jgi:UDP-N-acetylglucosamine--N-acetylmuramyl-(pentapeptide) pyrophosphoryl-undecaprenol N-acetylglucosamine transferase
MRFKGHVHFLISVSRSCKILIACGGTGGHLFPGIAVAEALLARGHEVLLLISEKKVDAEASAKYPHLRFETVAAVAKPFVFSPAMLVFLWKMAGSVRRCKALLRGYGADVVLGMGGFTSLPPVYAGHKLGLRTFIHDSNARPGRANVLTSRFCTGVLIGLEAAREFFPNRETVLVGTPVRPEIMGRPSRAEAAARFGLNADQPTILVTGGSQGARRLNELSANAAAMLPPDVQILHIAGALDFERVSQRAAGKPNYKVLGFCDQMPAAYAVADLVIARAGASSLNEIAMCGLPSILVPYPHAADDHQTCNARVFSDAGAAILAPERDLDAGKLASAAASILQDLQASGRMAKAACALAIPDASERVCDIIEASLAHS